MKRGLEDCYFEPCKRACSDENMLLFAQQQQQMEVSMQYGSPTNITAAHFGQGPSSGFNVCFMPNCAAQFRGHAMGGHEDMGHESDDDAPGENFTAHQQWWAMYMQQVGCGAIVPE